MPSLLDLRRRIRAVKSTQQITKAMKMISASKLRRAQERVVGAQAICAADAAGAEQPGQPGRSLDCILYWQSARTSPDAKVLLIVVTADKGLCGGFNTNIVKAASSFIASTGAKAVQLGLVGRKGRDFFKRRGFEVRMEEIGIFQRVRYADAKRIADAAIEEFTSGRISKVFIVYNEFKSVMQQRVTTEQLLPIPKLGAGSETGPGQRTSGRVLLDPPRAKRRSAATLTTSTNPDRQKFSATCFRSTSRFRFTGRCSSRRQPSTPRG